MTTKQSRTPPRPRRRQEHRSKQRQPDLEQHLDLQLQAPSLQLQDLKRLLYWPLRKRVLLQWLPKRRPPPPQRRLRMLLLPHRRL